MSIRKNFSYSTVATAPSPATSGTSLILQTGDGSKFTVGPATVWPVSSQPTVANAEIVAITAISTDTLTIVRSTQNSTARSIGTGDQIANTVTVGGVMFVSVLEFGATGNGTTDDSTAINAAITAVGAAGGGIVYLPPARYGISNPINMNQNNVHIVGSGILSTEIYVLNSANCNAFQYTGSTNIQWFSIESLKITGNNTNNTSGYGVYVVPGGSTTFWDMHLRDVHCEYFANDGFYSYDGHGFVLDHFLAEYNSGIGVNFPVTATAEPEVRNGTFKDNTTGGIFMGAPGGIVAENEVASNTGYGIYLNGTGAMAVNNEVYSNGTIGIQSGATGCIITGNYANSNGSYNIQLGGTGSVASNNTVSQGSSNGIYANSADTRIVDNMVFYNTHHGIAVNAANVTVLGNTLYQNSKTNVNTYDEINISSNNNVVVFLNTVNGLSTSRYGVNFSSSGSSGCLAGWNTITGESTASTNDATTGGVAWNSGANNGVTSSVPLVASATAPAVGTSGLWADGAHIHPRYEFEAVDHGLISWTYDPSLVSTGTALPTSGLVNVVKLHIPVATSVTNILLYLTSAGVALTSGQCFAGIYQGGTLLGTTADQSTAWGSSGLKTMAISGGAVPVAVGDVYIAFFFNGTTGPTVGRSGSQSSSIANVGLSATVSRYGTADAGRTTSLASTLGTISGGANTYWIGLS